MGYVIYGLKETRIILYEDDGTTPRYRITLEKEGKEGLDLIFKPEGPSHQLGSGADWAIRRIHRGFRISLDIKWAQGEHSQVETWNGTTWGAASSVLTAQALSVIHTWASHNPCRVSPHKDLNLDFLAQPDPGKGFGLSDLKGLIHRDLELHLVSTTLAKDIPDWTTINNYFAEGFVEEGFAGFQP